MNHLIAQYEKCYPFYEELTARLQALLAVLLKKQNLHIHSIAGRTKSKHSLEQKIIGANYKYRDLSEVTDLTGIRIITYYEDEVDQVAAFIRAHFSIDEENSVDKRKNLAPDRFGYLSLHLIVNLPPQNGALPKETGIEGQGCKFEIQIRSVLQHAWAEIEHDLAYKNKERETYESRRSFSRLAGLLELADQEFKKMRDMLLPEAAPSSPPAAILPVKPQSPPLLSSAWQKITDAAPLLRWTAYGFLLACFGAAVLDLYAGNLIHIAAVLSAMRAAG